MSTTGETFSMRVLHRTLRPAFGFCLFLSQFSSNRGSYFTDNPFLVWTGILFLLAGTALWLAASSHLQKALRSGTFAATGPFRSIRHPVYVSVYLLSFGLGFVFFAWVWFLVMAIFLPLWVIESLSEEKQMEAEFGEAYRAYQQTSKLFIPRVI